ncbi:hypothetical protein PIB30_019118 [Stylosanthes scabra]|uniref:Uncharacterized protein n=1 Tax=Stylosanthes scabra TaxID=79078 RepID=A0ABU6W6D6_9FABA|nr:hypothetical protein [Stylosanthes scabra]
MDGAVQTVYPRKNWSLMWLEDDEIDLVPLVWNFLEGHNKVIENDATTKPKAIHYTPGEPWFKAWKHCKFAYLWLNEMEEYLRKSKKEITN